MLEMESYLGRKSQNTPSNEVLENELQKIFKIKKFDKQLTVTYFYQSKKPPEF